MMDWAAASVAIFKALVSWPVATVLVAMVLKAELRSLMPRLRRAGPTGLEFEPADTQKIATAASASTEPGKLKEFPGLIRTPAIERFERQLHTALQAKADIRPEDRPAFLLRLLAQAQLEAAFERIYNLIFGSQILALRRLNERTRVTMNEAREFSQPFEMQYLDFAKGMASRAGSDFLSTTDSSRVTKICLKLRTSVETFRCI